MKPARGYLVQVYPYVSPSMSILIFCCCCSCGLAKRAYECVCVCLFEYTVVVGSLYPSSPFTGHATPTPPTHVSPVIVYYSIRTHHTGPPFLHHQTKRLPRDLDGIENGRDVLYNQELHMYDDSDSNITDQRSYIREQNTNTHTNAE